jgi:hypothetical protein
MPTSASAFLDAKPSASSFLDAKPSANSFLGDLVTGKYAAGPEAPIEAAMNVGSGMVAGFPAYLAGGLKGLATGAADPKEVGSEWSDAVTYKPRSKGGKSLSDLAAVPFQKLTDVSTAGGHKVADITGSPVAGALTESTLSMAPALLLGVGRGKGKGGKAIEAPKEAAPTPPSAPPVSAAAVKETAKARKMSANDAANAEFDTLHQASADDFFGPNPKAAPSAERALDLAQQTAKDMQETAKPGGVRGFLDRVLGTPGKNKDLYNPIRNGEQHAVAQMDRWAAGQGRRIRQAIPDKAEREAVTMAVVSGDLSKLSPVQAAVAHQLQEGFSKMGDYALESEAIEGKRHNYMPQIWDMSDKKTKAIIEMWREASGKGPITPETKTPAGGTISPFMLQRAVKDVTEGMRLGMKPASLDPAALLETYVKSMGRAVERSKNIKALVNLVDADGTPMAGNKGQVPRDYVRVDHPDLEGLRVNPDIAPAVRVVLQSDDPTAIAAGLQVIAYASKRALVSYSAFHVKALTEAAIGSGANPLKLKSGIDAAFKKYYEGGVGDELDKLLSGPLKIGAPLEDVMGRDQFMGVVDFVARQADTVGMKKGVDALKFIDEKLQQFTFDYVLTGYKLETALRKYEGEMLKNAERAPAARLSETDIIRQVGEYTNSIYGGLNYERMIDHFERPAARKIMSEVLSKTGRRWEQTLLLAPDWLASTVGSWTNALEPGAQNALKRQLAQRYLATSAVIMFGVGSVINNAFTGHSMFENKSTKKDATWADDLKAKTFVDLGNGQHVNIGKHFFEVPHAALDPLNFALGKTQPMVVGEPLEQAFNKEWLSTGWTPPITQKKDDLPKAAGKRLKHAGKKFVPIPGQSIMQNGLAGLGGFFGFPVSGMTAEQKAQARLEAKQ